MASDPFSDLLDANARYAESFDLGGLEAPAARALAVVTCIDSRIEPLAMLGLAPGDAKIVRNAGARVTDDVLRSLVLAVHLLNVRRVCIVPHTRCAMASATGDELRAEIGRRSGAPVDGWDPLAIEDRHVTLREDIGRIRSCPLLPADLVVGALLYDVDTGRLSALEP